MVVEMDEPPTSNEELTTRIPEEADLVALCRTLNDLGARYIVIGGFAIILAGFARSTADLDLLIDTSLDNEALVYKALEILPDKAVRRTPARRNFPVRSSAGGRRDHGRSHEIRVWNRICRSRKGNCSSRSGGGANPVRIPAFALAH